jgi:hypothetical protein
METRISHLMLGLALAVPPFAISIDSVARAENGNPPGYECSMHHNGYLMHKQTGCTTGGVNGAASRIKAPSKPKIGTYSPISGTEISVAIGASYIWRYGAEVEVERTIEGLDWEPQGYTTSFFLNSKFIYTRDKSGFSGSQENTASGQFSGITFNNNDTTYGTGFGSGSTGVGVIGNGSTTNSWHIGSLGFGANIIPDVEKPRHSVAVEIRPFWERIKLDSNGYAELQSGGTILSNTSQTYDLDTSDNYYGASLEARAYATSHFCDFVVYDVGGHVDLAYHRGKGSFTQSTNSGSAQVNQSLNYSHNGFTVGGGVSGGATLKIPRTRLSARLEVDYSVLPEVTGFNFRGTPNDAEGSFSNNNLDRFTVTFGLKASF